MSTRVVWLFAVVAFLLGCVVGIAATDSILAQWHTSPVAPRQSAAATSTSREDATGADESDEATSGTPRHPLYPTHIGTVPFEGEDASARKVFGRGLYVDTEDHGGGRYYVDPTHSVTLHVEIGTDEALDTVVLSQGVSLPPGLTPADDPAAVSPALTATSTFGDTSLGESRAAILRRFGKPDEDHHGSVQRELVYEGTSDSDSNDWVEFDFVHDRLRSVAYNGGD